MTHPMSPSEKISRKVLLRNKLKIKIAAISKSDKRKKSRLVCRSLWRSDFVQGAKKVLIYAGRRDELDTMPLIRRLLRCGKEVYLPRIDECEISIYRIQNFEKDLCLGSYGIHEPRKIKSRQGHVLRMDLAILPGLGFTRHGVRLGRGGGHFDRLLEKAGHVVKMGVGFREQIVKEIPAMRHDIRMNFVVTD